MKRTQTKSYPFISQLSFWQKSTQTKRTLTDELPTTRLISSFFIFLKFQATFFRHNSRVCARATKVGHLWMAVGWWGGDTNYKGCTLHNSWNMQTFSVASKT